MAAWPEAVSAEDRQTLQDLCHLLHVFDHRNKNQHRRSTWWRQFSIFRKQLTRLTTEVKSLHEAPTTHVERAKKKHRDLKARGQIEKYLPFWQDVMVARWQHAFSQVAADGRFSILGLVLLATLAEVCRMTGITAAIEDLAQAEVEKVLTRFAEETWEAGDDRKARPSLLADNEDYGEVIARDPIVDGYVKSVEVSQLDRDIPTSSKETPATLSSRQGTKRSASKIIDMSKKKRQKKLTGDAIDDLFNGLG